MTHNIRSLRALQRRTRMSSACGVSAALLMTGAAFAPATATPVVGPPADVTGTLTVSASADAGGDRAVIRRAEYSRTVGAESRLCCQNVVAMPVLTAAAPPTSKVSREIWYGEVLPAHTGVNITVVAPKRATIVAPMALDDRASLGALPLPTDGLQLDETTNGLQLDEATDGLQLDGSTDEA